MHRLLMTRARRWLPALALALGPLLPGPPVGAADERTGAPTLAAAMPPQLTEAAAGTVTLYITGHDLQLLPDDRIGNARRTFVYLRSEATDGTWLALHNILRDGGDASGTYPQPGRAIGSGYVLSPTALRLELPRAKWTKLRGTLEVKLVQGDSGDPTREYRFTPTAESNVLRIPVQREVTYQPQLTRLWPEALIAQREAQMLHLAGQFAPGSLVLVNGEPQRLLEQEADGPWQLQVELPPLPKPQRCELVVRDPQGRATPPRTFWVYGPTQVQRLEPAQLTAGAAEPALTVFVDGFPPPRASWQLVPAPPGATGAEADRGVWRELHVQPLEGALRLALPAAAVEQAGALKLRLTSPTGVVETQVQILPAERRVTP